MILPEPRLSICRPACWVRRKTLVRSTSMTAFQSSSECSAAGERRMMPALLTRMSMVPKCWTVSSTRRAQTAASPMSPTRAADLTPSARIFCCVAAGAELELCTATLAPASASATAMAAPSPRDEPVTSADFPFRLNCSRIVSVRIRGFVPFRPEPDSHSKCFYDGRPSAERWKRGGQAVMQEEVGHGYTGVQLEPDAGITSQIEMNRATPIVSAIAGRH